MRIMLSMLAKNMFVISGANMHCDLTIIVGRIISYIYEMGAARIIALCGSSKRIHSDKGHVTFGVDWNINYCLAHFALYGIF